MPLSEVTCQDERSLQDVADLIAGSHKVLVITGAGISTSIGIPVSTVREEDHQWLISDRTSGRRTDCTI